MVPERCLCKNPLLRAEKPARAHMVLVYSPIDRIPARLLLCFLTIVQAEG